MPLSCVSGLFRRLEARASTARFVSLLLLTGLAATPSFSAPIDACSLITREEIRRVQREDFREAKSSSRPGGTISSSQCFWVLPTFTKSISLEVTSNGPDAKTPHPVRDYWNEQIASPRKHEEEREEEGKRPDDRVTVRRVGEKAFWIRGGPTAALYALSGDRWIRVSIGGKDPDPVRMARAMELARFAIKRLNRR